MAYKVIIAVVACLAAITLGCTDLFYKDELPASAETYLNDATLWPMKVLLAKEQNNDAAAQFSCYSIAQDFTVTAYDSETGAQKYTEAVTSKAANNQSYTLTYTPTNVNFLGVTKASTTVTLKLASTSNDFTLWEGCSTDSNTESKWLLLKNSANSADIDGEYVEKALETTYNIYNSVRKGIC